MTREWQYSYYDNETMRTVVVPYVPVPSESMNLYELRDLAIATVGESGIVRECRTQQVD